MKQTWRVGVVMAFVALLVAGRSIPPVGAAITGISPGSVTIDPGGGASATVTVVSNSVSCLSLRPSSSDIDAEVSARCDAGDWRSTLTVSASLDTPPGTYSVRVVDQEGGEGAGRTLTIRVRDTTPPPPTNPPPPPPTTTTTATTTTTTRPTSTTSSTSTPTPTSTTTAPTTPTPTPTVAPATSAPANANPAEAFTGLSSLVARGIAADGVFLPLTDPSFRNCLPLRAACGDATSGLVIVPARTTSMRWDDPSSAGSTPGLRPLEPATPPSTTRVAAVGDAPTESAGTARYALPVLSVSSGSTGAGAELRSLDAAGQLSPTGPGTDAAVSLLPVAVGPLVPSDSSSAGPAFASGAPFGRPTAVRSAQLTEAAPAIVLLRGTGGQVLHGIRPDPDWNAGIDLIPLFTESALPYLVRGVDGPPGLFIPRPADMRVAPAPGPTGDDPRPYEGRSPVAVLAGAAAVAAAMTALATVNRRRNRSRIRQ